MTHAGDDLRAQVSVAAKPARRRLGVWAVLVVSLIVGHVAWLLLLRGQRMYTAHVTLVLGQLLLGMGVIAIAGLIASTPVDAIKLQPRLSRWIILSGAALFQLLALILLWPALTHDVVRYRLDGLSWLYGQSPYAQSPRQLFLHVRPDALDRSIPSLDARTTHGPVSQTLFIAARAIELGTIGPATIDRPRAASYRLRDVLPRLPWVQRAIVWRTLTALAAIGCTVLLLQILAGRQLSPWLAALLAWNPLFVLEAAGNGHVEIFGVLLLLVMLRMLQRRRTVLAALALCLACGIHPLAIVLTPLLIRQIIHLRDWQIAHRTIGVVLLTLALVYAPLLLIQHGHRDLLGQVQVNLQSMPAFNSVLAMLAGLIGPQHPETWLPLLRLAPPVALVGALLWLLRRRSPVEDAGYWLTLCPLLVSSVVYPRMLLWSLAFVPLMRHTAGWTTLTWSATAGFAYTAWAFAGGRLPGRIIAAEYLPVLLALSLQLFDTLRRPRMTAPSDATVSA